MNRQPLVGQSAIRKDAIEKATGKYVYGMDFHVQGALESVVLRSPLPHALIKRIDIHKAEALEGVRAIIIGSDLPEVYYLSNIEDQPPLAVNKVRYQGEPVALVAADTLEIAEEGSRLIDIEYEPLPVVTAPEEALLPEAALVHPNWWSYKIVQPMERYGNLIVHSGTRVGDVEKGFAESDFIFEDEFSTASVHQCHVEPRSATAQLEDNDTLTVFANTQLPFHTRAQVAHIVGWPEERVRIVCTGLGGGFGSKLYAQIEPLVALLSIKTKRAVHMVTTLEEELTAGLPRHPCRFWLKTGVKKDGTIVARQAKMVVDSGAYAGSGPEIAGMSVNLLSGPYHADNILIDGYAVYTNKTNFGAYRGPGGPQCVFALESHFDNVARKLHIDPLEFRLKNILHDGDEAADGQVMRGCWLQEALEKAAAAIEWGKPAGPNRGKGLALGWWTTTGQKSTCQINLDEEGHIVVSIGTPEIGTGAVMGSIPQVIADLMQVDLDDVIMDVTDTSKELWDFGSQGSRVLFNVGRATQFACSILTDKIKELASHILEVDPKDLILQDKAVVDKNNPEARVTFATLKKLDTQNDLWAFYESIPEREVYKKERMSSCVDCGGFNYPSFHCHAVEVEVDPETGQVKILRFAGAHDIGHAVNPTLIIGQIQGGAAQGIGMGLMEEIVYQNGIRKNISWTDYKIPTIKDVPETEGIIVEHPVPGGGPFGAKGLGESPTLEPPAALANAIADATGIRIYDLPITAEKILKAMKEKEAEDVSRAGENSPGQ